MPCGDRGRLVACGCVPQFTWPAVAVVGDCRPWRFPLAHLRQPPMDSRGGHGSRRPLNSNLPDEAGLTSAPTVGACNEARAQQGLLVFSPSSLDLRFFA